MSPIVEIWAAGQQGCVRCRGTWRYCPSRFLSRSSLHGLVCRIGEFWLEPAGRRRVEQGRRAEGGGNLEKSFELPFARGHHRCCVAQPTSVNAGGQTHNPAVFQQQRRSFSHLTFSTSNMSTSHTAKPTGPLAPQYITGVYIPSAILIAGTAVFKLQWLPLAIAVCAALGGYQVFNNRKTIGDLYTQYNIH